jgi:predicted TIM-barrel fold metal-dependent hydrolase
MAALAAQPNIVSKLSGLGTFLRKNDPAHIASILRETVALFGAGRCLFGSNFPIEKLWTSYADLIAAYRAAAASLPEADQVQIFAGTARRTYRLA